jgi:hypothetical protein
VYSPERNWVGQGNLPRFEAERGGIASVGGFVIAIGNEDVQDLVCHGDDRGSIGWRRVLVNQFKR